MLHLAFSLQFPRLVRQGETVFRGHPDSNNSINLYKLNWGPMDESREQQWIRRVGDSLSSNDQTFHLVRFPGTLPKTYDDWVKDMLFAIPRHYQDEIRRTARMAVTEWATERSFDTMIRDICLGPAIEYAYVSFRLLADCLYDQKTNYYDRREDKFIVPQVLLYKFWSGQTGRGLVRDHAHFERLTKRLETYKRAAPGGPGDDDSVGNDSKTAIIQRFIEAIDKHEKDIEELIPQTMTTAGPSLSDSSPLVIHSDNLLTFTTSTSNNIVMQGDVEINGSLTVKDSTGGHP